MINFVELESKTVKLNQGDPGFTIEDSLYNVPRAAIEIQANCPGSYIDLLAYAITRGWIKPIAYIKKSEQVFDMLERS